MTEAVKRMAGGTPTQRFVAWALADCHNEKTGICNPTCSYLESVTGYGNKAIWKAIEALEKAGHITAERHNGGRNHYKIHPKTYVPPPQVETSKAVSLSPKTCVPESKSCVPESSPLYSLTGRTGIEPEQNPLTSQLSAPCTEEQAWLYAKNILVTPPWTPAAVSKWHANRCFGNWRTKGERRITKENWMHDLRQSHSWATQDFAKTDQPKKILNVG